MLCCSEAPCQGEYVCDILSRGDRVMMGSRGYFHAVIPTYSWMYNTRSHTLHNHSILPLNTCLSRGSRFGRTFPGLQHRQPPSDNIQTPPYSSFKCSHPLYPSHGNSPTPRRLTGQLVIRHPLGCSPLAVVIKYPPFAHILPLYPPSLSCFISLVLQTFIPKRS